jgi:Flp pilus assembly protein TadG
MMMKMRVQQIRNLLKKNHRLEKGQAMILIALAMIGLIAFIGLAIDAGILFSNHGHLRRGVDAAALSAANQIRQGWSYSKVETAAQELILLNLPATSAAELQVKVETCDTPGNSIPNCDTGVTKRKLARVEAVLDVKLAFLPIIGWDHVPIRADAISEAASIDLMLVIDNSTSMAYDAACDDGDSDDGADDTVADDCGPGKPGTGTIIGSIPDDYYRDPANCNDLDHNPDNGIQGACEPFESVRSAAKTLVGKMFAEYDRMGLVTFNRFAGITDPSYTIDNIPWGELPIHEPNKALSSIATGPGSISEALDSMIVYPNFDPPYSNYCYEWDGNYPDDPRGCMRTNIAAALKVAGDHLNDYGREDSVKVLVLLSDGIANAAYSNDTIPAGTDPKTIDWYCPDPFMVWGKNGDGQLLRKDDHSGPFCADGNPYIGYANGIGLPADHEMDAEDAARLWADWVGCLPSDINEACASGGAGVIMFAIGLGDNVVAYDNGPRPELGEELLRYIARVGYNGDPSEGNDLCYGVPNSTLGNPKPCGNYYYAPEANDLTAIFAEISDRIFTRLTH